MLVCFVVQNAATLTKQTAVMNHAAVVRKPTALEPATQTGKTISIQHTHFWQLLTARAVAQENLWHCTPGQADGAVVG